MVAARGDDGAFRPAFSITPAPWRDPDGTAPLAGRHLPRSLFSLAWRLGAADQVYLCLLAVVVALLDTVPIDIQRRMINHAIKESGLRSIVMLALSYAGVVLMQGLTKLLSNIYRSWTSEHAVRLLRSAIGQTIADKGAGAGTAEDQGTHVSMIVAESEPIGAFMGECVSEPLLQAGIIVVVVGYLAWLEPVICIVLVCVYGPQALFVPLMQRAINKRAQARITTLREASAGVIEAETGAPDAQDDRFDKVFRLNIGVYKLKYSMNFLMNLCHQFGIAAVLGLGGWMVVLGKIQIGTVVAFVSGLATVKDPWDDLATWFQTWRVTAARYVLLKTALEGEPAATPAVADAARAAE